YDSVLRHDPKFFVCRLRWGGGWGPGRGVPPPAGSVWPARLVGWCGGRGVGLSGVCLPPPRVPVAMWLAVFGGRVVSRGVQRERPAAAEGARQVGHQAAADVEGALAFHHRVGTRLRVAARGVEIAAVAERAAVARLAGGAADAEARAQFAGERLVRDHDAGFD